MTVETVRHWRYWTRPNVTRGIGHDLTITYDVHASDSSGASTCRQAGLRERERLETMGNRKGVTAWEIEAVEENGDDFFVLTFHHGLGKMTRLDLDSEQLQELTQMLRLATYMRGFHDVKEES